MSKARRNREIRRRARELHAADPALARTLAGEPAPRALFRGTIQNATAGSLARRLRRSRRAR